MALADADFPFSEELLHKIINSFVVDNAAAALPTVRLSLLASETEYVSSSTASATAARAADCSDDSSVAQQTTVIAAHVVTVVQSPQRRMTEAEQRLLSAVTQSDPLMREAVHREQWDVAASRWNSFIHRCSKDATASRRCTQSSTLPMVRSCGTQLPPSTSARCSRWSTS
jgi:hypothetical protein